MPLKVRIEMIKVVLGNITFPNELHMKGQVIILGPQDKILRFHYKIHSLCFNFFIMKWEQ